MPAEISYCEVYLIPRSVTTFGWGESATFEFPGQLERNPELRAPARLFLSLYRRYLPGRRTGPATIRGVRWVDARSSEQGSGVHVRAVRMHTPGVRKARSARTGGCRSESTCSGVYALG